MRDKNFKIREAKNGWIVTGSTVLDWPHVCEYIFMEWREVVRFLEINMDIVSEYRTTEPRSV